MEKIIKKVIGKEVHTFMVQGANLFDVMNEAGKLSFGDVKKCDICGCEDLHLGSHIAKNKFKYVTIRCKNHNCKASLNFGQQQENPEIFYLRTREEKDSNGKTKKVLDWKKPEDQDKD